MPGGGISRLLKQLSSEDWISRIIDSFFSGREPEKWGNPDYTIKPSGASLICPRSIELGMLGHRPEIKERNRRRMDNGSDAHRRWQNHFREMGILAAAELPVRVDDPHISGKLDLVLQNPTNGALAVGEIKTTNSRKFSQLPKPTADRVLNAKAMYAWHRDWFIQFVWYCEFGNLNGRGWDERFFLIENTDNQDYVIILVEPTPEHIEECKRNGTAAQRAAIGGELISRPFERTAQTCRMCDRAKVCDLLEDGEEGAWALLRNQFRRMGTGLKTEQPHQAGPGVQL